jgi:hypothetical protein
LFGFSTANSFSNQQITNQIGYFKTNYKYYIQTVFNHVLKRNDLAAFFSHHPGVLQEDKSNSRAPMLVR